LKAFITGFLRTGNTYTANSATEMIKKIVAQIKTDDFEILFRMDNIDKLDNNLLIGINEKL
jgi:methionine salvage enolase-phosphatase E1